MGPAPSRMAWPPKVKSLDIIGEVIDTRGPKCPRDVGRSVQVGDKWYYVFGDTFCFDHKGDFQGVANNSIAYIPNLHEPTKSTYLYDEPRVPFFIPHLPEETKLEAEHKQQNCRIVNWSFGGLVEDEPRGCGKAWMWFEKAELHGGGHSGGGSRGVRVCRVTQYDGNKLKAERILPDTRIFRPDEPQFGNITVCLDEDGFIYCVGGAGMENRMARVKHGHDPTKRSNYQFLCKKGWQDDYQNKDELVSILPHLGQGQIVRMPGCGPHGKSYMVLCCDKWANGIVHLAWAEKIDGPWYCVDLGHCPKFFCPKKESMKYSMFPHPWCFDWNKGELLFTWSDDGQMGGAVIAGKITFEVEAPPEDMKEEEKRKR